MSERMRVHPTKKTRGPYTQKSENTSWKVSFKKEIAKHSEQGLYLRGSRFREGLTQKQLAKKLGAGVSQHHISEMENGKRTITPQMARRLAKILKTDYRMFL